MTRRESGLAASLQDFFDIPEEPVPPTDADRDPLHLHPGSPESREECIRKSLIKRLHPICAHLEPKDFDALVLKMTREQLRSEGIRWKKNDPNPC
ncbi:MAG: hypothetical protein NUW01_05385 [Gemmatimonadaceae bacterium]|nr:hypothetical protein [Gemmatimonadaceae bacterium]